jgi:hypothetical protein
VVAPRDKGVQLYVYDLSTGSIIAVLQAIAAQGRILFSPMPTTVVLANVTDPTETENETGVINDIATSSASALAVVTDPAIKHVIGRSGTAERAIKPC